MNSGDMTNSHKSLFFLYFLTLTLVNLAAFLLAWEIRKSFCLEILPF